MFWPRVMALASTLSGASLTVVLYLYLSAQVLAIAILILHYQTMREMAVHNSFVTTGTYVGFAIVVIGTVLGLVTGNVVNKSVVSTLARN